MYLKKTTTKTKVLGYKQVCLQTSQDLMNMLHVLSKHVFYVAFSISISISKSFFFLDPNLSNVNTEDKEQLFVLFNKILIYR